jgi:hypothetical protein
MTFTDFDVHDVKDSKSYGHQTANLSLNTDSIIGLGLFAASILPAVREHWPRLAPYVHDIDADARHHVKASRLATKGFEQLDAVPDADLVSSARRAEPCRRSPEPCGRGSRRAPS